MGWMILLTTEHFSVNPVSLFLWHTRKSIPTFYFRGAKSIGLKRFHMKYPYKPIAKFMVDKVLKQRQTVAGFVCQQKGQM